MTPSCRRRITPFQMTRPPSRVAEHDRPARALPASNWHRQAAAPSEGAPGGRGPARSGHTPTNHCFANIDAPGVGSDDVARTAGSSPPTRQPWWTACGHHRMRRLAGWGAGVTSLSGRWFPEELGASAERRDAAAASTRRAETRPYSRPRADGVGRRAAGYRSGQPGLPVCDPSASSPRWSSRSLTCISTGSISTGGTPTGPRERPEVVFGLTAARPEDSSGLRPSACSPDLRATAAVVDR